MNLKKVIEFAISNELDAHKFYKGVSKKGKDASVKRTFEELAAEEEKHRNFLAGFTSSARQVSFDGA